MSRIIPVSLLLGAAACACLRSSEPGTGEMDDQAYLRCAEPLDDGAQEKFRLPPLTVTRDGLDAAVHGIKRGSIVLGVLAGLSGPSPSNLKNLDYFLDRFRDAGVHAVVVLGDVGLKASEVEVVLERLARAPVPIMVIPGAQENLDVLRRAMKTLRVRHPQLLDMTAVRRVRIGHITLISLPGYHRPFYLAGGERGCGYDEEDIRKTAALFDEKRPTVILSPSPPRAKGASAVDRGRGGFNLGDPALARHLFEKNISFGIFGHVYESGGHATLSDGKTSVTEGIWQPSLFLQAGSAAALPMPRSGEGISVGMAQVVEFSASRGRYRTLFAGAALDGNI